MTYKVAIIGAGRIGSRHLQGLSKSSKHLDIYVLPPNQDKLLLAKQRYDEVSKLKQKNNVFYLQEISDLPEKLDLAIITTTADIRRENISVLVSHCLVKFIILEKVVFQKSEDFSDMLDLFDEFGTKVWVNCPRRFYPFYKEIKKEVNEQTLTITVTGNNWGLACNAVHMIDLLIFLTDQIKITFDKNYLDNQIYASKRNGFKELRGKFFAMTNRGDILELIDQDTFSVEDLKITIKTEKEKLIIDENKKVFIRNRFNLGVNKMSIDIPLQSQMTGRIVDQIIDTKKSDLTSFSECMRYHVPMLNSFNCHFSQVLGETIEICPIT